MADVVRASALDLAGRLFAAIEAGDTDTVGCLYAADAVVWHNVDGIAQSRDDNLRTLGWLARNRRDLRYDDVHRSATATGFVQQHVLRATNRAGRAIELPACVVGTVVDGHITRIDEYLDSAQLGRVTES